jgi:hypothetical protein
MSDTAYSLRLPAALMDQILEVSRVEDRSVNKTIAMLLRHGLHRWNEYEAEIAVQSRELEKLGFIFQAGAKEPTDEQG